MHVSKHYDLLLVKLKQRLCFADKPIKVQKSCKEKLVRISD